MNRRQLVKSLSLGGLTFSFFQTAWTRNNALKTKPIVLSTWYNQREANVDAWTILSKNGRAIDAVEIGVKNAESDILNCCVGLAGNPDRTGVVTLDACIMNEKFEIGAVGALERIKHPISVARAVMENSPHVMLVGSGAQEFAIQQGFNLEEQKLSDHAAKAFDDWKKRNSFDHKNVEKNKVEFITKPDRERDTKKPMKVDQFNHDTIGMVALDVYGNLSGACTTSGMGFKMRGRLGDSPIIGAGLYVDNEVGAATATGHGEEVIRICGSHLVVEFMRQGLTPELACKRAVERILKRTPRKLEDLQIGFIALNKYGEFGAYSLQKGFDYAVKSAEYDNTKFDSKYLI